MSFFFFFYSLVNCEFGDKIKNFRYKGCGVC